MFILPGESTQKVPRLVMKPGAPNILLTPGDQRDVRPAQSKAVTPLAWGITHKFFEYGRKVSLCVKTQKLCDIQNSQIPVFQEFL